MKTPHLVRRVQAQDSPLMRFLNHEFADMRRRLYSLEIRLGNSSAFTPDDVLIAPPTVAGGDPPVLQFTVSELFQMEDSGLTELENYYGVNHDGEDTSRRLRMLRILGATRIGV